MTYKILNPLREDNQVVVGKISRQNISKNRDGNLIKIKIGNYEKIFNVRDILRTTPTPEVFKFPNNPMWMYTLVIPKISQEKKEEKEKQMMIEAMM